ncbi:MAG: DUF4838 domain-containing protein [Bacillota bacterium]
MEKNLYVLHNSETVFFAASELARYLRLISIEPVVFHIHQSTAGQPRGIRLGLYADGLAEGRKADVNPYDDIITVAIKNGEGFIAGSNERSVLLGAYRFLREIGCRWVRPGISGEYIPRADISKCTVSLQQKASYRHRTVCIEGAVSFENIAQMIDWAPKVGFSGYFMQFPFGDTFFAKYYEHRGNTVSESEPFSDEAARRFTITIEQEIKKRGLIYHSVGHGWTCKAIGLEIAHWDPCYAPLSPGVKEMLAQVNGKREFLWDRPMITSLCFSRTDVGDRMVRTVVEYALEHTEVDFLHVWLDDGGNNKCECEECGRERIADRYVKMLGRIGKILDEKGSKTKIVFIAYSDLLWPPEAGTVSLDADRFIFMYANSRQSYQEPLKFLPDGVIPPYKINQNKLQRNMEEFNGFLQGWKKFFQGDSFLFEYYMTIGMLIFDQQNLARVIYEDIRALRSFGLNGLISCQIQRAFFPTGLAMYVMGEMLWQDNTEYAQLVEEYFHASFGKDCALCKEFLKVSAEEIGKTVRFTEKLLITPDASAHLAKLDNLIRDFGKVAERNIYARDLCHARSWYYIRWYLDILKRLAELFKTMAAPHSPDAVIELWTSLKTYICSNEERYQAVFDVNNFVTIMDRYIINGRYSSAPQDTVKNQ